MNFAKYTEILLKPYHNCQLQTDLNLICQYKGATSAPLLLRPHLNRRKLPRPHRETFNIAINLPIVAKWDKRVNLQLLYTLAGLFIGPNNNVAFLACFTLGELTMIVVAVKFGPGH